MKRVIVIFLSATLACPAFAKPASKKANSRVTAKEKPLKATTTKSTKNKPTQLAPTPAVAKPTGFDELSPYARLRRMAYTMLNTEPSDLDRRDLLRVEKENLENWFIERAQIYSQSEQFRNTMKSYIGRLLRMKFSGPNVGESTASLMIDDMLEQNLSWDHLLTSKNLYLHPTAASIPGGITFYGSALNTDEVEYLRPIFDRMIERRLEAGYTVNSATENEDKVTKHESNSSRLAGVLTDPHFLQRYWTTPVNQNRKRAAAIFRVFLCDEMRAVILPDARAQKEIEEAGFDKEDAPEIMEPPKNNAEFAARHANDQKCASCHFKLDPLANVFRSGSSRLPAKPVPGALSYRRRSGELVNVPFNNAQELAQALVSQPDYVSCQVKHFWNWFIGSDLPMSPATEKELIAKFNGSGRSVAPFVAYLVSRPEFHQFPKLSVETIQFRHVSGLLRDCNSCHDMNYDGPSLSKLPFENSFSNDGHERVIEKMIREMDLLGDGSRTRMPPRSAGWTVKDDDRVRLIAWLAKGAPNDKGEVTWNNQQLQIQLMAKLKNQKANLELAPTFEFTAKRRLTERQIDASVVNFLNSIGSSSYNNYFSNSDINLESGTSNSSAGARYTKSILEIGKKFSGNQYDLQKPSVLEALDLGHLAQVRKVKHEEDVGTKKPFIYYTDQQEIHTNATVESCLKIGNALFRRLFMETPSAAETSMLKEIAVDASTKRGQTIGPKKQVDCVSEYLVELFRSERFLTY